MSWWLSFTYFIMQLHDTHAHLDILLEHLELLDTTSTELSSVSVDKLNALLVNHNWLIHPTVSLGNYQRVVQLFANSLECQMYFLLGAHPEIVTSEFELEEYILNMPTSFPKNVVGIGEIGLDYHYTQDKKIIDKQKQLFRFHIELALTHKLPIVIHCREAFADLFTILDEYTKIYGNFLIHCFTGNSNDLDNVLTRQGKVAYGGVVTFKNAQELQQTAIECPPNSLVLETDLPFLAPTPHRGKTCLPEYIQQVALKIAEHKNVTVEEIWKFSQQNSEEFFALSNSQ